MIPKNALISCSLVWKFLPLCWAYKLLSSKINLTSPSRLVAIKNTSKGMLRCGRLCHLSNYIVPLDMDHVFFSPIRFNFTSFVFFFFAFFHCFFFCCFPSHLLFYLAFSLLPSQLHTIFFQSFFNSWIFNKIIISSWHK